MSPAQRDRSASCASRQTRASRLTCSSERKSGASAAPAASRPAQPRAPRSSGGRAWPGAARERDGQSSPNLRGARVRIQHKKSPGGGGALRAGGAPARRGAAERAGGTDRRAGGEEGRGGRPGGTAKGSGGSSGGRLAPGGDLPAAGAPRPRGQRKFREQLPSWGRGGELETRVPLKFAGRQERAGGSFPPSRLEREEEAGKCHRHGQEGGGGEKEGGGEKGRPREPPAAPRPPRPAPARRVVAPRLGALAGRALSPGPGSPMSLPHFPPEPPGGWTEPSTAPAQCGEGWAPRGRGRQAQLRLLTCASARESPRSAHPHPRETPPRLCRSPEVLQSPQWKAARASGLLWWI